MRIVPDLPPGLSPEQQARFETIAALARSTADRLPRPPVKALEPAHALRIKSKGE